MHEHSDKIQPKKLIVTVILTILLVGFGWYIRKDDKDNAPKAVDLNETASTTIKDLKI